ncbi:MAG: response regulator receiver protein [Sulfurimonas sp.]|nr:MAG: response regulator receiver protein [Sulfurimonas sp.]PHQ57779.1 MAG: response regulator receiver protein [Sulfurimonas sp.]
MNEKIKYIKSLSSDLALLYVEDNEGLHKNMLALLGRIFDNIISAKDGKEGYSLFSRFKPKIVITDINMPKINGFEMIQKIKSAEPNTKIIILSAYNEPEQLYKAIELGVFRYLHKPAKVLDLVDAIYKAVRAIEEDEKRQLFFNQLQTIVNYQTNLVVMINKKNIILSNQCFLEFFGVDDLESFNNIYNDIDSLLLEHKEFLYTTATSPRKSWIDEVALHPGKLFHTKMKNAQGEMCHLILKSRKIPDKEEWHVLSFDDVTELNLMQFFDKKATTNDELIHDKKTIMSFIKIVKENCTELKIHNFYKGLTIVNKGVVVDLTEDAVTLKTEIAQLRIVNLTKFMTISSEIFPKCIVCRSIKKIDFDQQKLVIEDMVFTSRSAVDRKYIRLEPEVNHTCALFYNDVEVPTEMKIADVSEVSAKVEVDTLPPGIDINKTVKLTMKFTLHSKPLTIITEASVYRIDENKNSFFVVVLFELQPKEYLKIKEYLANRQMALIREFKKMDI